MQLGNSKKVYEWSPEIRRFLSQEESKETPPIRSKSKAESKSNTLLILMIGGNKLAQRMKMIAKKQTRLDKNKKKIELMATTLEALIKDTLNENGENPRNGGSKMIRRKKKGENHSLNGSTIGSDTITTEGIFHIQPSL